MFSITRVLILLGYSASLAWVSTTVESHYSRSDPTVTVSQVFMNALQFLIILTTVTLFRLTKRSKEREIVFFFLGALMLLISFLLEKN